MRKIVGKANLGTSIRNSISRGGWKCFRKLKWSFGTFLKLDDQIQERLDMTGIQITITTGNHLDEVVEFVDLFEL
jgi:hypothetical protein